MQLYECCMCSAGPILLKNLEGKTPCLRGVKARYLSLPLETNFSVELSQSMPAVAVPSTGADAKDVQQMP